MRTPSKEPLPNAVVATRNPAVRDFLIVHLEDRGFAVASAEEAAFITWFARGAVALIADFDLWHGLDLPADDRPELLLISDRPATAEAIAAAAAGAVDYLAIPFASTRRLARTLDQLAARARARRRSVPAAGRELTPVG